MRTRTSARALKLRRRRDFRPKREVLGRFQAPERTSRDANAWCDDHRARTKRLVLMELRPTRMLNQGHLRPIVVEPIRRRPLETTQGRIATNSAASPPPDTGGTLVPNESEPQQAGGERPFSTQD